MNVLSLFDGMSCGRIALDRLGIEVDNYYASEIDKYAIKVSAANYPDIIQVGDVTQLDTSTLPKIDLIMGGSPCQGFSVAGKGLAFDDPRSALFFEFIRCVTELKPKYFLLENVNMKKEWLAVITEYMGVEGIKINSALVSAQNRNRWYWTNIPGIEQPEQRGIVLRDILETTPDNYTLMSDKFAKRQEGRKCLVDMNKEKSASLSAMEYVKNGRQGDYLACNNVGEPTSKPIKVGENGKSPTLTASNTKQMIETTTSHNGITNIKKGTSGKSWFFEQQTYSKDSKKTRSLKSSSGSGNIPKVIETIKVDKQKKQLTIKEATKKGYTTIEDGDCFDMTFPKSKTRRGRNMKDKSNCLTAANYDYMRYEHSEEEQEVYWRKLTPVECERLQTVPDNYTNHVSNTQRYKMLGNGWTIEVIAHILKKIEIDI